MIIPGAIALIRLACPDCGAVSSGYQAESSQFYLSRCTNSECVMRGADILIEKSSHLVLSVSGYRDYERGPLYPVLADEEGNQVWPKKERP